VRRGVLAGRKNDALSTRRTDKNHSPWINTWLFILIMAGTLFLVVSSQLFQPHHFHFFSLQLQCWAGKWWKTGSMASNCVLNGNTVKREIYHAIYCGKQLGYMLVMEFLLYYCFYFNIIVRVKSSKPIVQTFVAGLGLSFKCYISFMLFLLLYHKKNAKKA